MFAIAPENKLGIVILCNSENGGSIGSLYRIILEYAAEIKDVESDYNKSYPKYPDYKRNNYVMLEDEILLKDAGCYAAPGMCYVVEIRNHKLSAKIRGMRINLIPQDDGKYMPQIKILGIISKKMKKVRFYFDDVNGHHILVQEQMLSGTRTIIGDRIVPAEISDKWRKRLGDYSMITNIGIQDEEIFTDIRFEIKNDFLMFRFKINPEGNNMEFPLRFINENEGQMMGLGRYSGGVLQFTTNEYGEETLLVYGLQMKKNIQ